MSIKEVNQRKAYFKELGQIIAKRHGQNYYAGYDNRQKVTVDEAAVRLGRYLRAARINGELSIDQLARQTNLSKATLIALEHGLILTCAIKPKWLKALAEELNEQIEDFNLTLGRPNFGPHTGWLMVPLAHLLQCVPKFGKSHWTPGMPRWLQPGLARFREILAAKPLFATGSAIFFCLLMSSIVMLHQTGVVEQPPPNQQRTTFIDVDPERRLNMIKAEFRLEHRGIFISQDIGGGSCCIY